MSSYRRTSLTGNPLACKLKGSSSAGTSSASSRKSHCLANIAAQRHEQLPATAQQAEACTCRICLVTAAATPYCAKSLRSIPPIAPQQRPAELFIATFSLSYSAAPSSGLPLPCWPSALSMRRVIICSGDDAAQLETPDMVLRQKAVGRVALPRSCVICCLRLSAGCAALQRPSVTGVQEGMACPQ